MNLTYRGNSSRSIISIPAVIRLGLGGLLAFAGLVAQAETVPVQIGKRVALTLTAEGTAPFSYAWFKDGEELPGATGASYVIGEFQAEDAGAYSAVVANSAGMVISEDTVLVASLSVNTHYNGDWESEFAWTNLMTGKRSTWLMDGSGMTGGTVEEIPAGFDANGYLLLNSDLKAYFGTDLYGAWLHYYGSGIDEGRNYDEFFRVDEYLALYGNVQVATGANRRAALLHWLNVGKAKGWLGRVPVFFDAGAILSRYAELAAEFGGLPEARRKVAVWNHFLNSGVYEGRTDGDFDAIDYLADHPDLEAAFGSDLTAAALHWYIQGRYEGRRIPAFFSVTGYFERNPDIAAFFGTDLYGAWLHYRDVGVNEGRSYNEEFRVDEYIAMYPDLQAVFGTDRRSAMLHWLQAGRNEERAGRVPTVFDHGGYFARNPDVPASLASLSTAQQRVSAWTHFFYNGVNEGRNFDNDFRVLEYLSLNPDVQAAYGTKLGRVAFHWLIAGKLEGRRGRF